jgi:hypothetical protein
MDPLRVYVMLQEACRALEQMGDHAVAAHVGQSMALIEEKYGVGHDHLDIDTAERR